MSYILSAFSDEASKVFSEQLTALREEGITLIELRGVDGKNCAELTDAEAKSARLMLDDNGVALSALGSPYGKFPIDGKFADHLDAFKRGMELCHILGAERVRMFSFFLPKGETNPAQYKNKVHDQLHEMLLVAEDAGVLPVHENEKGIYGDVTERCLELAEAFSGRMGTAFDPANFIQCGVRPGEAYPVLKPFITYMHIKDAILGDGSVVPAGCGDGSLPEILNDLTPEGEMILTLEPHLRVFDGLNGLQDEEVKHKFSYASGRDAFAAAAGALRDVLGEIGYKERGGLWTR